MMYIDLLSRAVVRGMLECTVITIAYDSLKQNDSSQPGVVS